MEPEDALFDDIQTLSDDADALGLTDVALVLEFAMDVYLHEKALHRAKVDPAIARPVPPDASCSSEPVFLLAQIYRQAS